jgi:hypothetical protein
MQRGRSWGFEMTPTRFCLARECGLRVSGRPAGFEVIRSFSPVRGKFRTLPECRGVVLESDTVPTRFRLARGCGPRIHACPVGAKFYPPLSSVRGGIHSPAEDGVTVRCRIPPLAKLVRTATYPTCRSRLVIFTRPGRAEAVTPGGPKLPRANGCLRRASLRMVSVRQFWDSMGSVGRNWVLCTFLLKCAR